MGSLFGGTSRTGTSRQATNAGFSLLGAINPQLATQPGSGFDNATQQGIANMGTPVGSILQGIPGVQTFDQFGNPQPVGSNNLPTLLPGISQIGDYQTLFEQADSGSLSPSAQNLLNAFTNQATQGTDYGKLFGSLGLGGTGGTASQVSATPPPNIGVLTSNIIKDLPPEFQTFITDTLNAGSPERTAQVMNEFDDAISARMAQNSKLAGEQSLNVFASEGQATSGAAKAELKSLALQAATEANAQIAAGHIELLSQQLQALQIGTQLTSVLTQSGAAEQANLVSLKNAELQANAAISIANINARANTQQALIAATAQLEGQRMNMLNTGFEGLLSQNAAENQARINALQLPYNILSGVMGQQTQKQQTSGLGSALGGALAGTGSLLGGIFSG